MLYCFVSHIFTLLCVLQMDKTCSEDDLAALTVVNCAILILVQFVEKAYFNRIMQDVERGGNFVRLKIISSQNISVNQY